MHVFLPGSRLALLGPAFAVTFALSAPLMAIAQTASVATDGTGVARMSFLEGNVSLQRGDSADSLAGALNAPILGGDYVMTGNASNTEIQFDGSAQLRLGQDAQLRFTRLDTGNRSVQLAQGTLELRLLESTDGSSEIDTPSISIKPQSRGAYRVSVTSDGQTLVTVRSGEAEVDTPQGVQDVAPGTTLIAQGAASNPSMQTITAAAPDDFDRFNAQRDRLQERALRDSRFVNTDIGGIEDLDANGRWVNDGSYGHVWSPAAVGPDWAPYRDGRWVWEDGYGWTWIAAEPWGWAPYHYGSWYHSPSYGWCWYPPQPRIYAPWRPALVAFIGFGAGAGLSIGFGGDPGFNNIGWVPLAPYETYRPWWGNRYGYNGNTTLVNNVTNITNVNNVTNVTNVNVYRNVRYNAVSSVTSQRFLQGNFSRNAPVAATELRRAQVFHYALPIVPTTSNLRFSSTLQPPHIVAHPMLAQRSFAGRAAVIRRTSFAEQRVALASVTHAPITPINFKDAKTTPLVLQRTAVAAPAAAHAYNAPAYSPNTHAPTDIRATVHPQGVPVPLLPARPTYTNPAHAARSADPWTRFNQSRAIDPEHRPAPGSVPPAHALHEAAPPMLPRRPGANNAWDNRAAAGTDHQAGAAATTYREPPAATTVRREPAAASIYHQPAAYRAFDQPAIRAPGRRPAAAPTSLAPSSQANPAAGSSHEPAYHNMTPRAPQAEHPQQRPGEPHAATPRVKTEPHAAEDEHAAHPPSREIRR